GNHSAPGIVRWPSTAVGGCVASMPKKSQQACQKASMSVVDQRHIDSKSVNVRPRCSLNQVRNSVNRARAMRSGEGVHKTVPGSIIPTPKLARRKSALLNHDCAIKCPPLTMARDIWTILNHWYWCPAWCATRGCGGTR